MTDRNLLIMGGLATAAVLIAGGFWLSRESGGDQFAQCQNSVVAGGMGSFGTDFTLTDETGQRVTNEEVFSKPSLLYFGYSYCPDVCPLDSARNAAAIDLLKEQGQDAQQVFITVDPARDTPEVLAEYTDMISPETIGLTGSQEEIDAVSNGWRNYYKLNNEEDQEYYLVDHMTNTYLVMPQAGTVEFFGRDVAPEDMAESVGCYIKAAA